MPLDVLFHHISADCSSWKVFLEFGSLSYICLCYKRCRTLVTELLDLNCLIRLSFYVRTSSLVPKWVGVPNEQKCEVCNSKYFVPIIGRSEDCRNVLEKTHWGGCRRIWEALIATVATNEVKMIRFILF